MIRRPPRSTQSRSSAASDVYKRQPLIGLTATPFRNTNVEETDRLAGRYDRNRLDREAFTGEPYEELQRRRILARGKNRVLAGVDVEFSAGDHAEIDKYNRLPNKVESRLGKDRERNRRLVESVASLPKAVSYTHLRAHETRHDLV